MAQDDIWLLFMVHLCKLMISLGVFFIFSKFWFCGLLGGSKYKKMAQNDKKTLSFALYISGTIHHFLIFRVSSWLKEQKMA